MNSALVTPMNKSRVVICVVSGLALLSAGCATKKAELLEQRPVVPSPYSEPAAAVAATPAVPAESTAPELVPPEKNIEKVPVAAPVAPAPKPAKVESKIVEYKVAKNDSLWKIAWEYGVSTEELAAFNKMKKDAQLRVGSTLRIPPGGKHVPLSKRPLPKAKIPPPKKDHAATVKAGGSGDKGATAAVKTSYEPIPADGKYKVQKNDNLWIIAHRFGLHSADIRTANNLKSDALQVGQELILPAASGDAAATAATPAAAPEATPAAATPPAGGGAIEGLPGAATPAAGAAAEVAVPPGAAATAVAAPPAGGATAAPGAAPAANTLEHTVLQGEKLQGIADMYEVRVEDILKVNPTIKTDADLKPNMTIMVPYK